MIFEDTSTALHSTNMKYFEYLGLNAWLWKKKTKKKVQTVSIRAGRFVPPAAYIPISTDHAKYVFTFVRCP